MVPCEAFVRALTDRGFGFYTGVPDSLLGDFCAYLEDQMSGRHHVVAANEGNAIALAAGHYLAAGSPGLVYMQNSGQGNAANALVSLADPKVYGIPMLLIVGWRGEPGTQDEPQHAKQGEITLALLDTLGVPYRVLEPDLKDAVSSLDAAAEDMESHSRPFALVVKKGTLGAYTARRADDSAYEMTREDVVQTVAGAIGSQDVIVSTTGKTSRELFEYREHHGSGDVCQEFLTVGSMGHASQIALGISLCKPDRQVVCLDGDGALIMHMGSLAVIGQNAPENFKHVVVNNGAHDSVGGQATVGFGVDFPAIAKACGYAWAMRVDTRQALDAHIETLLSGPGPALLEARTRRGARPDLGRPTSTPEENKARIMEFLSR